MAEARFATMRQTHVAGERMFVDYAGTKLAVVDPIAGEVLTAELFVAVFGAPFVYVCRSHVDTIPS